jgi:hypothetical protein
MIEVREVLRQWLEGGGKKTVARRVGVDAKTARRYIAVAEQCGLTRATSCQVVYERGGDGPSIGSDQAAVSRAG